MEKIAQLVQSYFNFRAALLRSITTKNLNRDEFSRLTGLCGNSIDRRRANPDLWQPVEIYQVGVKFGFNGDSTSHLLTLATLINQLPDEERYRFLKDISLKEKKLKERLINPDSWLQTEIVRIFSVVRPR